METLVEGQEYMFMVEKRIALPDADYFILRDDEERKYLLPAAFYTNYKINPGEPIYCTVNKINCNGKIFFEPRHPVYAIGMTDNFEIYAMEQRVKHKTKETYQVALARNSKTNKAAVLNSTDLINQQFPFNASCKVVKIKKAEALLEYLQKI